MTKGLEAVTNRQLPDAGYIVLPRWLSATVILGLTIQFFWIVWFFAKQDSRVEQLEKAQAQATIRIDAISKERDRIIVLEQKFEGFSQILIETNAQVRELLQRERTRSNAP